MTTQCIACGIESATPVIPEPRSTNEFLSSKLWKGIRRLWLERRRRMDDRQAIKYLRTLDDALLKDIGVSRRDVMWAGRLPTSSDASVELEIIARGGIRGDRRR